MLFLSVSLGLGVLYLLGVGIAFFCAFPMRELDERAAQSYSRSDDEDVYE